MFALLCFFLAVLASPFKSKSWLEAENAALRHQLIVLRRKVRGRVRLTNNDRWFLVQLYRWFPSTLQVLCVPKTSSALDRVKESPNVRAQVSAALLRPGRLGLAIQVEEPA
jgi:hypothetical protein